jgi:PRTRC genetic system protein A
MRPAGYIISAPGGDIGTRGTAYTYVVAGDGLWLEADNGILKARACLAPVPVRGLPPAEPLLELRHGRIPVAVLSLAVNAFSAWAHQEAYAAIVWGELGYRVVFPPQEGTSGSVTYEPVPGTVVGLHSHGRMGAFFSGTDDRDDQGFQVSVVVGKLDRLVPAAAARLCIYGYHAPVDLRDVFLGLPPWIDEKFGAYDYE